MRDCPGWVCPIYHAGIAAGTGSGFWRMARHVTVQQALPNAFFDSLGLPRLEAPQTD